MRYISATKVPQTKPRKSKNPQKINRKNASKLDAFFHCALATALLGKISDRHFFDCKQIKCNEGVINNIYLQKKTLFHFRKGVFGLSCIMC